MVLPLLPVTAITGISNCARQAVASAPSAKRVSGTSIQAMVIKPLRSAPGWQMAATAPRCWASAKKAFASYRSPLIATNKSPGCTVRVSVCTRAIHAQPSPCTGASASHWAAWLTRSIPLMGAPLTPGSCASARPVAHACGPRTGAGRRRSPASLHGLFQPARPRR